MLLERKDDETQYEYGLRLIEHKMENPNAYDWQDIIDTLGLNIHRDSLRKACSVTEYSAYNVMKYFRNKAADNLENDLLQSIDEKNRELKKERIKLSTERSVVNEQLRKLARNELVVEKLEEAITNLVPLDVPQEIIIFPTEGYKEAILPVSDVHFGKVAEVRGLHGELLNVYDEEVFKIRMWELLRQTVAILNKENIYRLRLILNGDLIDGMLRQSQLQHLKYGVVDSTMVFAEFIAAWLTELSKYVSVDVYYALGNHSQIRPLGSKNGEFPIENMERIIIWYLESRLKDNINISIHQNDGDFVYFECNGINVMASHGEEKDLEKALKDYMLMYNKRIDMFITGHLHSNFSKTIGLGMDGISDCEVLRTKSICGIDDFSTKLRKSSGAGTSIFIIEESLGKTITYDINLQGAC